MSSLRSWLDIHKTPTPSRLQPHNILIHHYRDISPVYTDEKTRQGLPTQPPNYRQHLVTMPGLVSATGVLGFLSDEEPELKIFALQTLNDDIDTLWTEVAASVGQMYVYPDSASSGPLQALFVE